MHRFPTRQFMYSQISMYVSWYCRNFPSEETNQYLEPRCLLEHEETKNERKKQTKRETKFASVEGKPLSIYAANLRTAAVGIQDLGIPAQPDKPTTLGQRRDHFWNNTSIYCLIGMKNFVSEFIDWVLQQDLLTNSSLIESGMLLHFPGPCMTLIFNFWGWSLFLN